MIWQNPWAFVGLAAVAVPIAVHLLARRHALRVRFPTLRFLPVSPSSAVRRRQLSDFALLAVRASVVAAGVAALAQPFVPTADRVRAGDATLSRAIVIDTSTSMERRLPDAQRGIDAARQRAVRLEPRPNAVRTIEYPLLPDAIRAANVWLGGTAGRHELVVISDFQIGALGATDLAAVPADAGIRLIKVPVEPSASVDAPAVRVGSRTVRPRATFTADGTRVAWVAAPADVSRPDRLRVLAGRLDQRNVDAALDAALAGGVPATPLTRPVTVVFPEAAERGALVAGARPIDVVWMFDLVDRLRQDPTLDEVAATDRRLATDTRAIAAAPAFAVVTRSTGGGPLLLAARRDEAGTAGLLLLPMSSSGVFPAALLRSVMRAGSETASSSELEPLSLPADVLARWERAASRAGAIGQSLRDDRSDGRWLWGMVLLLIGLESWMRRSARPAVVREAVRDRTN